VITKVKLKNWRSHLNTELNLSEGTNCFVGAIGTGKTSILDAICFAFFGTFPQLQQRKVKLEDVIMKKPVKQDEAEVSVVFEINNDEWSVKRIIRKGRTTAELRKNGELVEGPQPSRVTNELEKVLKVNYELFSRAIYSEQNQLDMFLTIPKGKRMKKIDELLSIDKFEIARANTKSLINKFRTSLNERLKMVQNLELDENIKKLDSLKEEFFKLVKEREKMAKELTNIKKRKEKAENRIASLKEIQKRLQEIEENVKKFTALSELVEKEIEKIKEELVEVAEKTDEDLRRELKEIEKKISDLSSNLEKEKRELEKLRENYAKEDALLNLLEKEKIPRLEEFVRELENISSYLKKHPVKKIKSEISKNKVLLEKKQIEVQRCSIKVTELEDSVNSLSVAGSVCPVCDSKLTKRKKEKILTKRKKEIEKFKREIKKLKPEIEKLKESLDELEKKLEKSENFQRRFEEIKDCKKELKKLTEEHKKLKSSVRTYETQRRMFEKNISILENELKELKEKKEKLREFLEKKEEVEEKLNLLKEYKQILNSLNIEKEKFSSFSPSLLEESDKELKALVGLERELETRIEEISKRLEDKQNFLNEVENKKKMLENYKLEIKKIEGIIEQLQLLENALIATQEQLRKDFVLAVNQAMQTIWGDLYPYKDIYNIRLSIESGDYVLQLQDSTGWIPADGIASGGERSIACLALRIAFSLVLAPQLKWLVLDEPTHNLDNKAVEELANVLRERITNLVEQVFIITHDPTLESAVSGYLYRFERDKEKDGFTRVKLVSTPDLL